MSSHNNVNLAFFQITDRFLLLGCSAEPAQEIHSYRKLFHSLDKGIINLLCKDRGWHKVNYLAAFLNSLKGGAESNLRLSVAYVAAHKAVHDLGAFHVFFCILNGSKLILCLLIGEHFLKLSLPHCIRTAHIAFFFLTHCIKLHQLLCNVLNSALYF